MDLQRLNISRKGHIMVEEVWKVVESHPEFEVSNTGKVRNKRGKILSNKPNKCGYVRIGLGKKYGKNGGF